MLFFYFATQEQARRRHGSKMLPPLLGHGCAATTCSTAALLVLWQLLLRKEVDTNIAGKVVPLEKDEGREPRFRPQLHHLGRRIHPAQDGLEGALGVGRECRAVPVVFL